MEITQHLVKCEGSTYCFDGLQTAAEVCKIQFIISGILLILSVKYLATCKFDNGIFRLWIKLSLCWTCLMTYLGGLSKMEGNHRKYVNGNMFQFTNILKCEEKFPLCRFLPLTSPLSPAPLLLLPNPGLRGGKGGFGSLLRAIGAQVEQLQSGKMKRIHV